ncbi:hypothetical protein Vretimale_6463 [Volvox reticuliferus]|uniref:Uncharacterized protein n=1 Tax=Volvox reticuliferus TaxID=1737510 RepID=A0A8J4G7I4_9CHLO|nr:hypothetical protein Vretifemale_19960 [Volvox reticuliferus]GIM01659.1 hypothetical protein Vretimale_6463 [Volvox reticuliferus]
MPKRAAAMMAAAAIANAKIARPHVDAATAWRRRTQRLADLCMKLDAEHVLCKAMRRWPVAAVLETAQGWPARMFALVIRDWRVKKVARLLEAKGRNFTIKCCVEWEPEYLQVLLPQLDLVTARHVLAELFFKSDDKHLSAYECRGIVEQFGPKLRKKLLCKFSERDVERVMSATVVDDSSQDDSEEEEDEDDSMDGFIVDGDDEEEPADIVACDDDEDNEDSDGGDGEGDGESEGGSEDDDSDDALGNGATSTERTDNGSSSSDDDDDDGEGMELGSNDDDDDDSDDE